MIDLPPFEPPPFDADSAFWRKLLNFASRLICEIERLDVGDVTMAEVRGEVYVRFLRALQRVGGTKLIEWRDGSWRPRMDVLNRLITQSMHDELRCRKPWKERLTELLEADSPTIQSEFDTESHFDNAQVRSLKECLPQLSPEQLEAIFKWLDKEGRTPDEEKTRRSGMARLKYCLEKDK